MPTAHLSKDTVKSSGAHYTPPELAEFLAESIIKHWTPPKGIVRVLDPACGDGGLLKAIAKQSPANIRRRLHLTGYETDAIAVEQAESNLTTLGVKDVSLLHADFLEAVFEDEPQSHAPLFKKNTPSLNGYDVVISNPPYVRTQLLGAEQSQDLARKFGLTGRVDLYHAFAKAISSVMHLGGVMGLLTSNRFMVTQAGSSVRSLLRSEFHLLGILDLGDTKMFEAAVLPAIVVGMKRATNNGSKKACAFSRIYEVRPGEMPGETESHDSPLSALRTQKDYVAETPAGTYRIEQGWLAASDKNTKPWILESEASKDWLRKIRACQSCTFEDVFKIRVGIKTTADKVFIRDDWSSLPKDMQPEPNLLLPLITHHIASRWTIGSTELPKQVLYPHRADSDGRKQTIPLSECPHAANYLESHRERLESRKYVIKAGRQWYEIWVPHVPSDWSKPKLVFPDIAEMPRFFLNDSGAIINGDCYWMTLLNDMQEDWLLLALAVGNSTFIAKYYDTVCGNKLYAGRRRFMTQYVKQFPLPSLETPESRQILAIVSQILNAPPGNIASVDEQRLDQLVWKAFGVTPDQ